MRIGIVNDVALVRQALCQALSHEPKHQVIWQASNGLEAVQQCREQLPELILMDILMPDMDGVEATRLIMAHTPCPILLVTMDVERNMAKVFTAMGYGALDVVAVPHDDPKPLLRKINNLALLLAPVAQPLPARMPAVTHNAPLLIAIGASAGGPPCMARLLKALPAHFNAAILLVQHVDEVFAEGMARWLASETGFAVRLAQKHETPKAGQVLLAGTSDHLFLDANGLLDYSEQPNELAYKPSIDVFFNSVAKHWHGPAVGVLLTGMGRDGAQGLLSMREQGFWTIAQDRDSSPVYGMPKAAKELNSACETLSLEQLAPRLVELLSAASTDI